MFPIEGGAEKMLLWWHGHPLDVYKRQLRAIAAWAEERNIPCQVSLEQRMACGIGACLGCACKLRRDGREVYGHVCKDGPVFDSKSVVWEE